MKLSLSIICFIFFSSAFSQNQLSATDWQDDINYLQSEVHKNYSHLFKKVTAEDFDSAVDKLRDAIPTLQEHEIRVGLARLVALFKYGHTQIPYSNTTRAGILPIHLYHFNDGIYIEGVHKTHKDVLGAKLIKIEDTPIDKALELVYPVVPVENESYFKAYGLRFLLSTEVLHAQRVIPELTGTVTLTLEKEGRSFTYEFPTISRDDKPKHFNFTLPTESWITARDTSTTPNYLKHLNDKYYYFELLDDNKTLYARQSSVFDDPNNESLKDFYKRLFDFIDNNDVNKLIYDVRLNGGGNNYNNLDFIKGLMARPNINTKGKLFFIIGRDTFSAAQNLTNEITRYTEAILVGEPTAENVNFYGDARRVVLPNSKISAYLSYAWWQDAPQWENRDATLPHIAVDMTYKQYISNEDPVLEAALDYKDDGFILKPMAHLTELFIAGNFTQLRTDATEIAKNPKYKYYDFEKEFGKAGGRLLLNGNVDGAIYIYQLLTEVYPDSAGHYFNLAGALEQADQNNKAIATYKLLIERFPEHTLAIPAKNSINSLSKE